MAKILIADKNPRFRERLTEILKSFRGNSIIVASDGLEALGLIYSVRFDLIYLDVALPQIDGIGLLEAAKKRNPFALVIMTCEKENFDLTQKSMHIGAYEFINKSISDERLTKAVTDTLDEAKRARSSGYIFKDKNQNKPRLIRNGIILAAIDSIMVGLTLFIGFILQTYFSNHYTNPAYTKLPLVIFVCLGLAFCYAFTFVLNRSYRADTIISRTELARRLLRDLIYAYVIQLALLFIIKDLNNPLNILTIGLSFFLGFSALLINRFLLIPMIAIRFSREGRRKIVFIRNGNRPEQIGISPNRIASIILEQVDSIDNSQAPNSRFLSSSDELSRIILKSDIEEVYIPEKAFSISRISGLIDRFKGRKLKITIYKNLYHSDRKSEQLPVTN